LEFGEGETKEQEPKRIFVILSQAGISGLQQMCPQLSSGTDGVSCDIREFSSSQSSLQ
jgi:hypothetical protein